MTVQWPLWSEPKLIVLGTDLWLTSSSSLLFWAFEIRDKVLCANSSTTSSICTWHFLRPSLATNAIPPKSEVVFLKSQFSAALSLLQRATETRSERKPGSHAVYAWKPGQICWLDVFISYRDTGQKSNVVYLTLLVYLSLSRGRRESRVYYAMYQPHFCFSRFRKVSQFKGCITPGQRLGYKRVWDIKTRVQFLTLM